MGFRPHKTCGNHRSSSTFFTKTTHIEIQTLQLNSKFLPIAPSLSACFNKLSLIAVIDDRHHSECQHHTHLVGRGDTTVTGSMSR